MDLSASIHLLGDILGEVICEQESQEIFDLEESIRGLAKARRAGAKNSGFQLAEIFGALQPDQARAVAAAFSLYFDLVNLAEEHYRVQILRQQEREWGDDPNRESIAAAVGELKSNGVTPEQMAGLLRRLDIELVLTAHPTEAKRRTILSKIKRIAGLLDSLGDPDILPRETEASRLALRREITAFWLTDRARTARPTVTDEVRTGLYYVDEIFWQILPQVYADLDAALGRYYPGLTITHPWMRLASWIGGDRDGNPNVTAEVTAETLRLHRGLAVEKHRATLQDLARQLSLSSHRVAPPSKLNEWFERRRPLPSHVSYLEARYASEPYRLILSLLAEDLAQASRDDVVTRLLSPDRQPGMASAEDFIQPLELILEAIPISIASGQPSTVMRQLEIFGLHAARLDMREDSSRLNSALGEILRALGIHPDFDQASDASRTAWLIELLAQPAPRLAQHPGVTAETAETLALFQLIARARQVYGPDLLGPFIISMTRSAADILAVLLLGRWTGCIDCMDIVPLFESMADLEAAPAILSTLFMTPAYRRHLATCEDRQTVMIGYSDSNKDGGYLAANWALYQSQQNIAGVCREHQVVLTLFHGRGGTVARGGGPANRAIRAQPAGTINGRFRLTEQGEIIASRYLDFKLAHRQLEQIVNAVLLASSPRVEPSDHSFPESWDSAIRRMSESAYRTYHSLVYETPGFVEYWKNATPLDEIKRLFIGSRPVARQSGEDNPEKIRAIPWVFSWMQSRFNLPGWYGLGSGIEALGSRSSRKVQLLQEMYREWPFFQAIMDNAEMSLLKADMGIAVLYSNLVTDQVTAEQIFDTIRTEYQRTVDNVLKITGHTELMDGEPVIQRSIHLRNPYVDPLNYIQVELLRRLRALQDPDGTEATLLREAMVLTINGIAAGLRNTG